MPIPDPIQGLALPPLSLYIHFPWCIRKCPYCDFNSHPLAGRLPESRYIDALIADLQTCLTYAQGRTLQSIFLGGGTPSLFSPDGLARLLDHVSQCLVILPSTEITLEANPGTVDRAKLRAYRQMGINRLSVGVQSLHNSLLRNIGRIHDRNQAISAVEAAQAAGFDTVNLDLMFGLPGQSPKAALNDINEAIALAPQHIAYYQLTLEPDTRFGQTPPCLPAEDLVWTMHTTGVAALEQAGYAHYEVSAYAQPEQYCRHNLNYWRFGDYLGIGAGAHSKLTLAEQGTIFREQRLAEPFAYMYALEQTGAALAARQTLTRPAILFELMLNALRLTGGLSWTELYRHTGLTAAELAAPLADAKAKGWLWHDQQGVGPTDHGLQFLNDLLLLFLPDAT